MGWAEVRWQGSQARINTADLSVTIPWQYTLHPGNRLHCLKYYHVSWTYPYGPQLWQSGSWHRISLRFSETVPSDLVN